MKKSVLIVFSTVLVMSSIWSQTAFGQKQPKKMTTPELLQLADRMVKTPIKRKLSAQGDEFVQRDLNAYLKATVHAVNDRPNDPDYGHDHKEDMLQVYLNRSQPSVKTYHKYFNAAAKEFKVPVELLMAVGQVQSNWAQVSESMYGSWGVMGVIENKFIQQITEAAAILKVNPQLIKDDAKTNIRAAAAMLAKYQQNKNPKTLEDWFDAAKDLTGLQDPLYKEKLAVRFYDVMAKGSKSVTLWGEIIELAPVNVSIPNLKEENQQKQKGGEADGATYKPMAALAPPVDYAGAVPNFTTCNYSSRNGAPIEYYFVHYVATGTYEGAISWFKNCSSQVSAHYVIRNSDGEVSQVVAEASKSWSQGVGFYNDRGIGTEHEVLATNLAMWYSDPMLTAGGNLARDVCNRRSIPKVRAVAAPGINGHNDVKSTSCPNMTQEVWDLFMGKVNSGAPSVAKPTLYTVSNPGTGSGVTATWKANTEPTLAGYRLYYATDDALTSWALVADENTLGAAATQVSLISSANFAVPPSGDVYHFKLTAVVTDAQSQKIESMASDIYSRSSNVSGSSILIVDGFDRTSGSYTSTTHSFANNYFKALRDSKPLSISTAANERIADGSVVLSNYNMVVWFTGDESTVDETFSTTEQTKISTYLVNGGKLLVSGSEIAWDLDNSGTTGDKSFIHDYLKASYVGDGSSSFTPATGVTGTGFAGLTIPFGVTYPEDFPDAIAASGGSTVILNYAVASNKGGVAYKGIFGAGSVQGGVVYVSFPLETASLANHTSFMDKTLTYFGIGAAVLPPVAANDTKSLEKNTSVLIDVLANDNSNGSTFNNATVSVVTAVLHGTTSVNTSTGQITYTPTTGYTGSDSFTYTVANAGGAVSNQATVSLSVIEPMVCLTDAGTKVALANPKREQRGIWLSTVANIDWPTSRTATPTAQKAELTVMLDSMVKAGINAVFFQIRPECDALYASTIDPWSYYLTGTQGQAPSPLYDPLSFIITEAHARGIELHAWINPYRAKQGTPTLSSTHVASLHPDWTFLADSKTFLNPGLPQVRSYIISVIEDVSTRYNIDGIHFDDYFYPYSGMSNQDAATYAAYNPSGLSLAAWRRDNVNKLVASVYDKIQDVNVTKNSNIKFGISPFGIWKSGVPAGITGMSAYDDIYADALNWLGAGKVDYISPQLYWTFGGGQDYTALSAWWDDQAALYGRHHFPGLALYRLNDSGWAASVIQNQITENRKSTNESTYGQVFFTTNDLLGNDKNIKTLLQGSQYKYKSIPPASTWKDGVCPNAPTNINYATGNLTWLSPTAAVDGDLAVKYVVYRFNSIAEISTNAHDGTKVAGIVSGTSFGIPASLLTGANNYFVVSALDKNNNESAFSTSVNVPNVATYCTSKGNNSTYEWISSVTIGSFVHASGNNGGYGDFTSQVINLTTGSNPSISLVPSYQSTAYNENWKIWIDFNQDGDFLDAGELVFNPSSTLYKNTVTGSISIPLTALAGNTRMRVSMNGTSANYTTEPCTVFGYGEVQDYTVNLTPGNCTAPTVTDKIIDDAAATLTGTWTTGTSPGYYGTSYKHDGGTGQGTKTATFTPSLGENGSYELFIYYVAGTNRATNAPVVVYHLDGTTTVNVNQQLTGSTWKSLGTFNFGTTSASKVVLKNDAANGVVIADAFRWVYKGCSTTTAPQSVTQPTTQAIVASLPEESSESNTIKVYPNPVMYDLNLNIDSKLAGKAKIRVVNINGKQVTGTTIEVHAGKTFTILNTTQWPADIYTILVEMPDGETVQTKVVKQ